MNGEATPTGLSFLLERSKVVATIAACMLLETALILLWVGIAWLVQIAAQWLQNQGCYEPFVLAFKWVSSAATFLLMTMYVARDIISTFRSTFLRPNGRAQT